MPTITRDGDGARMPRFRVTAALAVAGCVAAVATLTAVRFITDDASRRYLDSSGWPVHGQAAYVLGRGPMQASPHQLPVPIASVAKVMTALVVLRAAPLAPDSDGFHLRAAQRDVSDTRARAADGESVVPLAVGEVLTERQALVALLLPSANNVAIMLARRVAGTVAGFVTRMNATAERLGMRQTTYTDPSGLLASTRSTAADQLRLAQEAMRQPVIARLVGLRTARLPVAGTVHNTDTLLGTHGFVGIKTGSDDAAGGCFMFRARRTGGVNRVVTGVVLGQRGHNLIAAGLYAAAQLVDRLVVPGASIRPGTPGGPSRRSTR
jgi:serine-type D-Ala-D-Ala carboxypeptidase (penicillin-binding protein 5/6)